MKNPYETTKGWFFHDEAFQEYGAFKTEREAKEALQHYIDTYLRPRVWEEVSKLIDTKFKFVGINFGTGTVVTEENGMVFKAGDYFLPTLLRSYISMMSVHGVAEPQIESTKLLLQRVEEFQQKNPEVVKVPDLCDAEMEACLQLKPSDQESAG